MVPEEEDRGARLWAAWGVGGAGRGHTVTETVCVAVKQFRLRAAYAWKVNNIF